MERYISKFKEEDQDVKYARILEEGNRTINDPGLFKEAVIDPKKYLQNICDLLEDYIPMFIHYINVDDLLNDLNILFFSDKLNMEYGNNLSYIGIASTDVNVENPVIHIPCSTKILSVTAENKKMFMDEFKSMAGHEIIHREQILKIAHTEKAKRILKYDITKRKERLSKKQEIMSIAWQIIHDYKAVGKSNEVIKELLKYKNEIATKHSLMLQQYIEVFPSDHPILKLLYKYMYQYLDGQGKVV